MYRFVHNAFVSYGILQYVNLYQNTSSGIIHEKRIVFCGKILYNGGVSPSLREGDTCVIIRADIADFCRVRRYLRNTKRHGLLAFARGLVSLWLAYGSGVSCLL